MRCYTYALAALGLAAPCAGATVRHVVEQPLDHFAPAGDGGGILRQVVYVNDDHCDDGGGGGGGGPAILYSVGERGVRPADASASWAYELARQTRALVVVPELRFFGESRPAEPERHLQHLRVEQMMADVRRVVANATAGGPWVLVGGSFAGSLMAWTAHRYPELRALPVASSAPMRLADAFWGFDRAAARRLPCAAALSAAVQHVDRELASGDARPVRLALGLDAAVGAGQIAAALTVRLAQLAQAPAGPAADAQIRGFCAWFADADAAPAEALARAARPGDYVGNRTGGYAGDCAAGDRRAWLWLQCTQLGLWQTAPPAGSPWFARRLRSRRLTAAHFRRVCRRCFPATRAAAGALEDLRAFAERARRAYEAGARAAVFTTGELDPWRALAVAGARLIEGAAHAQDLLPPPAAAPVAAAQRRTARAVQLWVAARSAAAAPAPLAAVLVLTAVACL
ncbi:Thymus-specific serine protease [Coemansia javaensis]|uniref:Thymus-specific serine protease n=1 Tax=Coemansia javaensis TaxID=2761396 RepID=A0A9W8HJW2_9FUNG|nr:Thymus-specific serine protease [Coemansia javaensis]